MHHAVNEFKNKSRDPNSHTTLGTYPLIWKTPPSIDSILILDKLITESISSDKINFASFAKGCLPFSSLACQETAAPEAGVALCESFDSSSRF